MALNVPLLRDSFNLVVTREPQLTARFYSILFERYPQAQALFTRNTPETQQRMLTEALVAVVDHLEDPGWLEEHLVPLGSRHAGYGVTPGMYDWVGASLLAAMADVAGEDWTKQHEVAWSDAYGAITSLMLSGAATTGNEPTVAS